MGVDGLEDFKISQRFIFHPLYTLAESVVNYWASARDRRKREKDSNGFQTSNNRCIQREETRCDW